MGRIEIIQGSSRSYPTPPIVLTSPYHQYTVCPPRLPVQPEPYPYPPTSHPKVLLTPPTSHPRTVLISSPPRHIDDLERELAYCKISSQSGGGRSYHSRSSSSSSNRSASPPMYSRSVSPAATSSRSSSTASRRSVRFAEAPEYAPPERVASVVDKGWEYVSSRGMAYHYSEFHGRSGRQDRDRETLVVEKARHGGRERRERRDERERERRGSDRYW
ncbi:hypothetical protein K440DRAFT_661290 [Wilcoxina mikolae CBS 423.85]|nr:hypothetical protein K440DRAFT_661290 [Wilcoxina mikolae CBS 423.85]